MKYLSIILLFSIGFSVTAQEQDPCYSINDVFSLMSDENPSITKNFVGGWNMFGYPCSQSIDLVVAFSSIVDVVILVKDNNGSVYMPEFGFNGIGFLEGGDGYQIKMANTVYGFSFCQTTNFPAISGCIDCEAVNFNQWATTADGSCNYDTDGDGINDADEIIGCQDVDACNYEILATDLGDCIFEVNGYDCDGNIDVEIGDEAFGGIVFYIDETGQKGLVVESYDLGSYEYGCNSNGFNEASEQGLFSGLQNTVDLLNCSTMGGGSSGASACYEHNGSEYTDWFLPSIEELEVIYNSVGQGSELGNVSGFGNNIYLSSTNNPWSQFAESYRIDFSNGSQIIYQTHISSIVRPIRAFGDWIIGCVEQTACNYSSEIEIPNSEICDYYVQIGDAFGGGIVFYVDESCQHGLIASVGEISEGAYSGPAGTYGYEWGCYASEVNGADDAFLGSGLQNSLDITYQNCTPNSNSEYITAADAAISYIYEGFDDWYLPSIDELNLLNSVFELNGKYWSSTEMSLHNAHTVGWSAQTFQAGDAKIYANKVRPIRSF